MTTSPLASPKLHSLLTELWNSPVFGTSYPSTVHQVQPAVLQTLDDVYHQSILTLDHVLGLAWPDLHAAERDIAIRQVAAKSVAFCGAVAAGEITHAERLRAAASAIALVSWTDQTMDRGDAAMVTAVELVSGAHTSDLGEQAPAVQRYIAALGWFLREVAVIARPEDGPWLLRCLIDDTLAREARMRRLSAEYLHTNGDRFWDQHAAEVARLTVDDVGFIAVTGMVYAIYRQQQPHLPLLMEILHEPALMQAPLRAACATIRVLDDIGDQTIDTGSDTRWGVFTINLCNQDDPRHLSAFLDAAGVGDASVRSAMLAAWRTRSYARLTELWLDYVRASYAAIPDDLRTRYGTFLRLSQRVIEAGLVNALGDDVLAEEPLELARGA